MYTHEYWVVIQYLHHWATITMYSEMMEHQEESSKVNDREGWKHQLLWILRTLTHQYQDSSWVASYPALNLKLSILTSINSVSASTIFAICYYIWIQVIPRKRQTSAVAAQMKRVPTPQKASAMSWLGLNSFSIMYVCSPSKHVHQYTLFRSKKRDTPCSITWTK